MKRQMNKFSKYLLAMVFAVTMLLGVGKAMEVNAAEGDVVTNLPCTFWAYDATGKCISNSLELKEGAANSAVNGIGDKSGYDYTVRTTDIMKVPSDTCSILFKDARSDTRGYIYCWKGNKYSLVNSVKFSKYSPSSASIVLSDNVNDYYSFQYRYTSEDSDCFLAIRFEKMSLAEDVSYKISILPETADITIDNGDAIKAARAAYDNLSEEEQSTLTNELATLTAAEAAYEVCVDKAAAQAVAEKINAIPAEVTLDDQVAIEDARNAYDALTDDQLDYISAKYVKKLQKAEAEYVRLDKIAKDEAAAQEVAEKINAIPVVALNDACKTAIDEAKTALRALTEDQKAYITDEIQKVLTDAETQYNKLVADKAAADKAAAEAAAAEAAKKAATPAKVKSLKVKKVSAKKVKLTWKKVKGCTGYEVVMRTGKKGSFKVIKNVNSSKKITLSKAGLKKNKSYTFKVRAYTTLNGEKIYGAYSAAKTVKMK